MDREGQKNLLSIAYIHLYFFLKRHREKIFEKTSFEVEMSGNLTLQAIYAVEFQKGKEKSLWEIQILYKRLYPIYWSSAEVEESSPSILDYFFAHNGLLEDDDTFIEEFLQRIKIKSFQTKSIKHQMENIESVINYYFEKLKEEIGSEKNGRYKQSIK